MLLDFLVCDDIREEKAHKLTLVGVYSGDDITIQGAQKPNPWPVLLPKLGMFIRFLSPDFVPETYTLRVLREGAAIAAVSGEFVITEPSKPLTIVVVGAPFPIPGPGALRFELTLHRGKEDRPIPIDRSIEVKLA